MQIGFFDIADKQNRLSELGDSLEVLNLVIDWNMFLPVIKKALYKEQRGKGGRPPYDYIMMFKILVLQKYYNLSDEQAEYQITDRISFMRFLKLGLNDKVPDAKTIWHFRNILAQQRVDKELFDLFDKMLEEQRMIAHQGSIIDATFADVPRQHNTPDENKTIKEGQVPEEWSKSKRIHKDTDARMAKKRDEYHYGFKNHVMIDAGSKLMKVYCITPANAPDFKAVPNLIDRMDNILWGDSAYNVKPVRELLEQASIEPRLLKGNTKGHKISDTDREENTVKSRVRVRVEHVFGFMKSTMKGINQRCIGIVRNSFNIGLSNLVYNIFRYAYLKKSQG